MDFKCINDEKEYEIETKGTTIAASEEGLKKEISAKKKANTGNATKIGLITIARKPDDKKPSKFVVCDDLNEKESKGNMIIMDYVEYYRFVLSLILDSTYYNRFMKKFVDRKIKRNLFNKKKIRGKYLIDQKEYVGEYFDKRLDIKKVREILKKEKNITLDRLFQVLTKNEGIEKYFFGIDANLIDLLADPQLKQLRTYMGEWKIKETEDYSSIEDIDGIAFITSKNKKDKEIEKSFSEDDIKKRLKQLLDYCRNNPHECGALCKSREKKGKPCEIMTYREYCHFHR
jgi:hypothetical protein